MSKHTDIEEVSDQDVTSEIEEMFEDCVLSYKESYEYCYRHCACCSHVQRARGYIRCDVYQDDIDNCAPLCEKCL